MGIKKGSKVRKYLTKPWNEIEFREDGVSKAWLPVYGQTKTMLCEIDIKDAERDDIGPYRWAVAEVQSGAFRVFLSGSKHPYKDKMGIKGSVYLARIITDAPKGLVVDHVDHQTLNNKRSNLRVCTHSQNQYNLTGPRSHNKLGNLGVWRNSKSGKYDAVIRIGFRRYCKGGFDTLKEAVAARLELEKKYVKEWSPRTRKAKR